MSQEAFCPIHGPYDAVLGSCPYCKGAGNGRPVSPPSLGDMEDMPTDLGRGDSRGRGGYGSDDEPTQLRGKRPLDPDEDVTNVGAKPTDDETIVEFKKIEGPEGILWVKEGARRGKIYPLARERMTIGRQTGNIVLNDPKVTRAQHAIIAYKTDHWAIIDSLSENGTCVNGEKITSETTLKENDLIKIGDTIFVLKILD